MSDTQIENAQTGEDAGEQPITFIVVSHTHWDREWWLPFQQFRMKLVRLIDKLLYIFEHEPEYAYFTLDGQTVVLEDYLEVRPEREADLYRYVSEGRLLVGPWYVLPDEFLVSGESLIRNLQRGVEISGNFGATMPVGYIPDPFGHISQIPQILRGFGIGWAVFWRGVGENVHATEFLWRSPDGSTVLSTRLPMGYSNGRPLNTSLSAARWQLDLVRQQLDDISSTSTILLLNGDDHAEPSRELPGVLAELNAELADQGVKLVHGTMPQYRAAVVEQLTEKAKSENGPSASALGIDTHTGEFRVSRYSPLLPGVLSTRMWIKQSMQNCENLLERWLEPWEAWHWALARQFGGRADWERDLAIDSTAALRKTAWKYLMHNQPHDSVCGCSVDLVHDEMKTRFAWVEQMVGKMRDESLHGIAGLINTQSVSRTDVAGRQALVVWNPLAMTRTDMVLMKFDIGSAAKNFTLYDGNGLAVPHEILNRQSREVGTFDLEPAMLEAALAMAPDGKFMDLVVLDVNLRRSDTPDVIDVEILVSDTGHANMLSLQSAIDVARGLVERKQARVFRLRAYRPERVTARFMARDIPGFGYKTYLLAPSYGTLEAPKPAEPVVTGDWLGVLSDAPRPAALFPLDQLTDSDGGQQAPPPGIESMHPSVKMAMQIPRSDSYSVENEFLRLEIDADSGLLNVTDKRSGMVISGGNRFVDVGDAGDEYNYSPPPTDQRIEGYAGRPRIVALSDPNSSGYVIEGDLSLPAWLAFDRKGRSLAVATSAVRTVVRLLAGVPRVDISTSIDNRSGDHWLRVLFDVPVHTDKSFAEGTFDVVERAIDLPQDTAGWVEQPVATHPQKSFCGVGDGKLGVLLANRGLPEFEVLRRDEGVTIALTLLRCVGWLSRDDLSTRQGNAGPSQTTPGAQMFGPHRFEYSLIPFEGSWLDSGAYMQAQAFASPLYGSAESLQAGPLPANAALIQMDSPQLVASAFKRSEDGTSLILRAWNISDKQLDTTIALPPYTQAVRLARLDEQPLERLHAEPQNRQGVQYRVVRVRVKPREVITLRIDM